MLLLAILKKNLFIDTELESSAKVSSKAFLISTCTGKITPGNCLIYTWHL